MRGLPKGNSVPQSSCHTVHFRFINFICTLPYGNIFAIPSALLVTLVLAEIEVFVGLELVAQWTVRAESY